MQHAVQTHSRILPDPWHDVGPGLCFLFPQMLRYFQKQGQTNPLLSSLPVMTHLMVAKEVQPPHSSGVISHFDYSLNLLCFMLRRERNHFEKGKKNELTQQIVTDLLLFIMVNMY